MVCTQKCSCAAILLALDKVHASMTLFSLTRRIHLEFTQNSVRLHAESKLNTNCTNQTNKISKIR